MPQTEQVDVKLPSGETITAVVPAGSSDADVHSLLMQKHPEFFQASAPARFTKAFAGQYAGALQNPMGIMPGRTPALATGEKGNILPWSQQSHEGAPGQSFSGMWQDIKAAGQSLVPTQKIEQGDYAGAAGQELANVLMLLTGRRAFKAGAVGGEEGGGGAGGTSSLGGQPLPGQTAPVTRTVGGGGLVQQAAQKAANIPAWVPEAVGTVPVVGSPLANTIRLVRRAGTAVTTMLPDDGVTVTIAPAEQFSGSQRPAGPVQGTAQSVTPSTTRPEAVPQPATQTGPSWQQFSGSQRPAGPVQGEAPQTPMSSTRLETNVPRGTIQPSATNDAVDLAKALGYKNVAQAQQAMDARGGPGTWDKALQGKQTVAPVVDARVPAGPINDAATNVAATSVASGDTAHADAVITEATKLSDAISPKQAESLKLNWEDVLDDRGWQEKLRQQEADLEQSYWAYKGRLNRAASSADYLKGKLASPEEAVASMPAPAGTMEANKLLGYQNRPTVAQATAIRNQALQGQVVGNLKDFVRMRYGQGGELKPQP